MKIQNMRYLLCVLLLFTNLITSASTDEIQTIAEKYKAWIVGSTKPDYSNPLIKERYGAILKSAQRAHLIYADVDFSNLEAINPIAEKEAKAIEKVQGRKVNSNVDVSHKDKAIDPKKIFHELLFPLSLVYNFQGSSDDSNPDYHNPITLKKILHLFEYLRKRGWQKGLELAIKTVNYQETGFVEYGGSNVGLDGLSYALSVFLMRDELENKGLLEAELQMVDWISSSVGPAYDTPVLWKVPGYNSDGVRAIFNQRLCYIFSLPPNHPDREKEMLHFQRMLDKSLKIAVSWNDMIKPDYVAYHHKNPYMSAYPVHGFHAAAIYAYLLNNTKYHINDESVANLSNALLNYRIYSNKYDVLRSVTGRFPNKLNTLQENFPAFMYMANLNNNPLSKQLKAAFMRLWNPDDESFKTDFLLKVDPFICYFGSMGALEACIKLVAEKVKPESAPNGYWYYPYAGMTIYRQGEWMTGWKGISKYIWDYEGTAVQNRYGRFNGSGVLQIYASGNPVSAFESGYETDGWNWCRLPGATTFDMQAEEIFTGKHRNFVPETFLGGVKFDEHFGLSAMSYLDPQSSLRANKTLFFMDNLIFAVGSDIRCNGEKYQVQTTITQLGIGDGKSLSYLNHKAIKGTKVNIETTVDNSVTYVDAKGHSYYFPKGQGLTFERKIQNEPLERGNAIKTGTFEVCRIVHGLNPQSANYQYVIAINGGEEGVTHLEKNFDNLFHVNQMDSVAHIVEFMPKNITAYAVRKAGIELKKGLVKKVDTPCLFILRSDRQNCTLSVSNPEFGRTDKFYTFNEVDRENPEIVRATSKICPVQITLKGKWGLEKDLPDAKIISALDAETVVLFNCFDGKSIPVNLLHK